MVQKRKTTKKAAKKKAWDAFSRYIRVRDCLRFKNSPEEGICVTCGREYPLKKLQAGHFVGGRTSSVLFDERIVFSQCYGCNVGRSGNYLEYFFFMEKEIGRQAIDELIAELKAKKISYELSDYIRIREIYEAKCEKLLSMTRN